MTLTHHDLIQLRVVCPVIVPVKGFFLIARAALITGSYLWLMPPDARYSSRWSIAGITDAMLGVLLCEKNSVASLKI
jgi:hypothetical protein